jgi:hypothetical protein
MKGIKALKKEEATARRTQRAGKRRDNPSGGSPPRTWRRLLALALSFFQEV